MLDTGIVYKHRGIRNKNTQHQNATKQIMIPNNKQLPPPSAPPPSPLLPPLPKKEEKSQWTLPIHFMYQDLVNITICFRLHCIDRRLLQNVQRSVLQTLNFHLCITKCCKPYFQCVVITKYSKISHPENDWLMFSLSNLQEALNNLVQTLTKRPKPYQQVRRWLQWRKKSASGHTTASTLNPYSWKNLKEKV